MSLIHDSLQQLETRQQTTAAAGPEAPAHPGRRTLSAPLVAAGLVLGAGILALGIWWLTPPQPGIEPRQAEIQSRSSAEPQPPAATAKSRAETADETGSEERLVQGWPGEQQNRVVGYQVPRMTGPLTASVKAPALVPPVPPALPERNGITPAVNPPAPPVHKAASRKPPRAEAEPRISRVSKPAPVQERVRVQQLMDDIRRHVRQGQFQAAEAVLQILKQSVSETALTYKRMQAYLDANRGRVQAALTGYETILRQLPQDEEALGNISLLLIKEGRREQAAQYLARLQRHHPGSAITRQLARYMEPLK